jgi:hypothetical protein
MSQYCPKCGTENVNEAKFCKNCGLNLSEVAGKKNADEIRREKTAKELEDYKTTINGGNAHTSSQDKDSNSIIGGLIVLILIVLVTYFFIKPHKSESVAAVDYVAPAAEVVDYVAPVEKVSTTTSEVFKDNKAKLLWQDNNDAITVKKDWIGAMEYCKNLSFAGFDDWRLPDHEELKALYAEKKSLAHVVNRNYWSSSKWSGTDWGAIGVGFNYGDVFPANKSDKNNLRCVHSSGKIWNPPAEWNPPAARVESPNESGNVDTTIPAL